MTRRYRHQRKNDWIVIGLSVVVFVLLIGGRLFIYTQKSNDRSLIPTVKEKIELLRDWIDDWRKNMNISNSKISNAPEDPIKNATEILRIGVMSDSHGADENIDKAVTAMVESPVELILHLGDFSEGGEAEHFASAKSIITASGLPYRVLPGDHDFNWFPDHSRQNYEQVFGQAYDQAFEFKGVRLILLENSVSPDSRNSQMDWLKTTLISNKDQITLFFSARPLYSPYFTYKEDDLGGDIIQMLVDNGVKYAFAGDTHVFAKYQDVGEKLDMITVGAVGEYKNPLPQWVLVRVFDNGFVEVTPQPITDFTNP